MVRGRAATPGENRLANGEGAAAKWNELFSLSSHPAMRLNPCLKLTRSFFVLSLVVGALLTTGCFHRAKRSSGPSIGGTVVYITNVQLPADATIELQLVELSRNGEAVKVIAGETLPRPPKVPAAFELPYQKQDVRKRTAYGVSARILSAGNPIFVSPRPTPVLTLGNPRRVEVVVEPVRKR